MIEETGKRRRSRIELGYYRAPDRFSRWRGRLCLFAIVATTVWLGASAILSPDARSRIWSLEPSRLASKGPLARPHAIWDSTCAACHVSFAPINGSRWSPSPWTGQAAGGKRCTACHAGPVHHQSVRKEDVPDCAECHRDHRGRDASLLVMDDTACTRCHQNLAAHHDSRAGPLTVAGSVTSFDREHHPDLTASWAARSAGPRRIKFNHALHLAAGLTLEKDGARLTFAQLPASDRRRYGWNDRQLLNAPVQLACASCHESAVTERVQSVDRRPASAGEPRNPGAYMLPIVYENHCAACHSLQFDSDLPEARARHGLKAQEVFTELKQFYTAAAAAPIPACCGSSSRRGRFPGRLSRAQASSSSRRSMRRSLPPPNSFSAPHSTKAFAGRRSCPRAAEAALSATP